jgi:hypothetical protein
MILFIILKSFVFSGICGKSWSPYPIFPEETLSIYGFLFDNFEDIHKIWEFVRKKTSVCYRRDFEDQKEKEKILKPRALIETPANPNLYTNHCSFGSILGSNSPTGHPNPSQEKHHNFPASNYRKFRENIQAHGEVRSLQKFCGSCLETTGSSSFTTNSN